MKRIYDSVKRAPGYPQGFKSVRNGTKKVNIEGKALLHELRKVEAGHWKKVYKDGFDSEGNEISLHYFESPSGKVFNVKTKSGWSVSRKKE
ncbi:MAG: hypothetical protein LBI44_03485 [Oscillospiraceae bacterium]|jgi:hypothetical protein|nr:hypothetical protein [Oscillospiraceae bacterium]